MKIKKEEAVSPVIGVMLMIVVTVIIAAVVSAFAGGYSDDDRKAPTAVISCKATGDGLLFTHESGDFIDLVDVIVVLTNGEDTRRFYYAPYTDARAMVKVSHGQSLMSDLQITTGNQFYLPADNDGTGVAGGYLGWDNPSFYLTTDEIGTYTIIDRESNQIISTGMISI